MIRIIFLFSFFTFFLFALDPVEVCGECYDITTGNTGVWQPSETALPSVSTCDRDWEYPKGYCQTTESCVESEDHFSVINSICYLYTYEVFTSSSDSCTLTTIATTETKYECIACSEPDTQLEIPEGYTKLMDIRQDTSQIGGCPVYLGEDISTCTSMGGVPLGHRENCCDIIDGCYGVPPDTNDTQCPPTLIKNEFGDCVCPPDTTGITVTPSDGGDSYPVCLPNSDCDTDKGQVYTTDGCLCEDGFEPDINATCLPVAPENTTDDNSSCGEGQYLCYGKCILAGTPCTNTDGEVDNPCSYPASDDGGLPYQNTSTSLSDCYNDSLIFGDGIYNYLKNSDCSYGACYYNNKSHDTNDTDISDPSDGGVLDDNVSGVATSNITGDMNLSLDLSPVTTRLDKIDTSINNQGDRLSDKLSELNLNVKSNTLELRSAINNIPVTLNSMNDSLGSKLTSIEQAIKDKDNSTDMTTTNDLLTQIKDKIDGDSSVEFEASESNITGVIISDDRMTDFYSKLNSAVDTLGNAETVMQSVIDEFETFKSNIETTWTQLENDFSTYKTMFDDKPTVTVPSGSCDLTASVLGKSLDLGVSLCSGMNKLSPIFVFIVSLSSQLTLIYLSLWLVKKD